MVEEIPEVNTTLARHCRLRAMPHSKFIYAISAYMIGNKFGEIIGGNLMEYMFHGEQNDICCPTNFKSRKEIEEFMRLSSDKVSDIESYCYDALIGGYNA